MGLSGHPAYFHTAQTQFYLGLFAFSEIHYVPKYDGTEVYPLETSDKKHFQLSLFQWLLYFLIIKATMLIVEHVENIGKNKEMLN